MTKVGPALDTVKKYYVCILVLALPALVSLCLPLPAAIFVGNTRAVPANFQNEVLITNLNEPTSMTFTPDGRMLILERGGTIRVVQSGASVVDPTPFLRITNINTDQGERGLVGIALDPNFAVNSYYYVFYTANSPLRDRVSRFTASDNSTLPGSEVVIWEDNVNAAFYHHGGTVAFGPDGNLYISTGDHFTSSDSQSLQSYHGKILRIRSDGTVPSDNPFFDGNGPNLDAIWAYGLRNPFRFSFDTLTGRMYIADVGGNSAISSIEELNVGSAGANYGWPVCEGPCSTAGMTNPLFFYPHNGRDASITGGFVYRDSQFPAAYYGSYFYGDYAQNWIRRLTFDASGNITSSLNFEPEDGSADGPYGEIVDIKQGPDGSLYYVDYGVSWGGSVNPGSIRRIRYTGSNQSPVAAAAASPTSGRAPLVVNFSSAGSSDPEGQPLSYSWDFGDGTSSTDANPTHTYTRSGRYTARLSVSDGVNVSLSQPLSVTAGNPPTATILSPASGSTFQAGDTISFSGAGIDPEQGTLPPGAFSWVIIFHHDSHTHPYLGPIRNTTGGSFTIGSTGHDYSGNTRYEIVLTVADADGLQNTTSVFVFPQKVNLSFDTAPSGLAIRLDGVTRTTPFIQDTLIGFQHTLEALDQTPGSAPYTFVSWSDGGARAHTIAAPEVNQTYAATYQAAPGPAGLAAAYGFNEGSGSIAADSSGNGNQGTLSSPTWTASGRFGSALSFDGTDDRVTSASLTLGPTFTLMAWVQNPSNASYETIVTIGRDRDLYLGDGVIIFYDGNSYHRFGSPLSNDVWHHVALSYDGSDLRAYLDGVLQGSAQLASLDSVSGILQVGAWINGARIVDFFGGLIDEIRIYNRALSQAEIQNDMNTPVGGAPGPVPDTTPPAVAITFPASGATVSGTITVSASASDDVGVVGVQFLLDGANFGAMDTTAPYSISWDTTTTSNGAHAIAAIARDAAGNQTSSNLVSVTVSNAQSTPSGLVVAYGFNEGSGTVAADASGNSRTGTLSGATWITAGRFGNALSFDGVDDWVTVSDADALDLTTGMTLEAWVFPTVALSGWRAVIQKEQPGGVAYYLYASSRNNARPGTGVYIGGEQILYGDNPLAANTWTHLAATFDGTTQRLYVNGVEVASRAQTGSIETSTGPLRLGGHSVWGEFFQGYIDEVRVYNRALGQAEIQNDMNTPVGGAPGPVPPSGLVAAYGFNEGSGTVAADASGNSRTGTLSGATWTASGQFGSALSFDGTDDRVTSASLTLGPTFTLMAWVQNPSNASYETIVTIGRDRDLYLGDGVITFFDGTSDRRFGGRLSNSVWHHVALSYDGSDLRAYLDGVLQGSAQPASLDSVSGLLQIGAWINGARIVDFFGGLIDEIRIYNRTLTAAEIQNDMNRAVSP
jgi:glucose/arabinose dehydrogenase